MASTRPIMQCNDAAQCCTQQRRLRGRRDDTREQGDDNDPVLTRLQITIPTTILERVNKSRV